MRKRLLPPVFLLACIILMVGLHLLLPIARVVSDPWTRIGALLMAAGLALGLVGAMTIKRHRTTIRPFEVSSALVRGGVFAFSRNPIYLGMIVLVVGLALLLGSLSPFVVCIVFALLLHYRFVLMEERMLAERFGGEWLEYSTRVRRWI
jgi:protein-S-isoprenylcysteine O-methyltransferase Ste14